MSWAILATLGYAAGVLVNLLGAQAAFERDRRIHAWSFIFIAVMCFLYVGFWGSVAIDIGPERGEWSEAITPFSTIFPFVFSFPAWLEREKLA